jgi:hypothetical protein
MTYINISSRTLRETQVQSRYAAGRAYRPSKTAQLQSVQLLISLALILSLARFWPGFKNFEPKGLIEELGSENQDSGAPAESAYLPSPTQSASSPVARSKVIRARSS